MTVDTQALRGRTALVTGAGRGIGRAVAIGLAQAGAQVALVARSIPELEQTARQIDELDGHAVVLPADLGDRSRLPAMLDRANAQLGNVDILINNAAVVAPLGPTGGIDLQLWAMAIEINVIAPAALSALLLGGMRETGWGRIVNISSSIAAYPAAMPGMNAYATSKAALEANTLNLAAELAGTGVSVNAFRPGSVDTAMQTWIREQDPAQIGATLHQRFVDSHQQGTLITAQDSAAMLIAHLLGEDTGQIWDAAAPTQR